MDVSIQRLLLLWCMGFSGCSSWPEIAPQHEEFSWTRDETCVPCTGKRILIHCATREVLVCLCVLVTQSCPSLWNPIVCPWDSPGKNTGVGCHSLLQGDLPYPVIKPRSPALAGGFFTIWAKCWITLHYGYLWGASSALAKVLRKEAWHMQRRDQASGVSLEILEHLPPKLECAYFLLSPTPLTLRGAVPHYLSEKRVSLQLQLIIPGCDSV